MAPGAVSNGAVLFAQFAYPPNRLGLCGPDDSAAVLEYASAGRAEGVSIDPDQTRGTLADGVLVAGVSTGGAVAVGMCTDWRGLRELARGFEGAWPYLQLIAAANRIEDPLDVRVVEAYWIGNELLSAVRVAMLGNSLDERFRRRTGRHWQYLSESLEFGARPHHNFHVFGVYPWTGLLKSGRAAEPLRILDQCRIRWARVDSVLGDQAIVSGPVLRWNGRQLFLGADEIQTVTWRHAGRHLTRAPRPGDTVALHWDWVCHVLSDRQLEALRNETIRHLIIANRKVEHPAPAVLLR